MSSPASPPPLDLDQIASALAGLRPGWIGQALAAGPLTWRGARASWPKPLVTDRSAVVEPESVGITLTSVGGRKGRLVIWRGGWADVDVLARGTVTSRNRALNNVADRIAEARSLASQLTAAPSSQAQHPPDLSPVTVLMGYRLVGRPGRGDGLLPGTGLLVPCGLRRRGRRVGLTAAMPALRARRRRAPAPLGPPPARTSTAPTSTARLTSADLTHANPLTSTNLTSADLTYVRWPEGATVPGGWKADSGSSRLRRADELSELIPLTSDNSRERPTVWGARTAHSASVGL